MKRKTASLLLSFLIIAFIYSNRIYANEEIALRALENDNYKIVYEYENIPPNVKNKVYNILKYKYGDIAKVLTKYGIANFGESYDPFLDQDMGTPYVQHQFTAINEDLIIVLIKVPHFSNVKDEYSNPQPAIDYLINFFDPATTEYCGYLLDASRPLLDSIESIKRMVSPPFYDKDEDYLKCHVSSSSQ